MSTIDEVAERALLLPIEDRADLVDRLLRSLAPPGREVSQDEATAAWTQVIVARSDALHEGSAAFVSWEEARQQLLNRSEPAQASPTNG